AFRAPPMVKKPPPLGGPAFLIFLQQLPRVIVLPRRNVEGPEFPKNFALAVPLILIHHGLEMRERFFEPPLLARDAAQLEGGIGLRRVDRHSILESPDRLRELPALLVNQAQLILGFAIVRIDRCGLEIPAKGLAAPQSASEVTKFPAEIIEGI